MNEAKLRDILAELGVDVKEKNSSGWLVCRCPFAELGFHDKGVDRNPSFFAHINLKKPSAYNCFTCGGHGSISALARRLGHERGEDYTQLAFKAKMAELSTDFGDFDDIECDTPPEPLDEATFSNMYECAWGVDRCQSYLAGRGITEEAAVLADLKYDPDQVRVLFPVRDYQGRLYGFSGRSLIPDEERTAPKVRDYGGLKKEWSLLGEDLIARNDREREKPILVVEGLFAYAHMLSIGARDWINPVATLGSNLSEKQRDKLVNRDRSVYFLYDDDAAGDKGLFGRLDTSKNPPEHEGGGALDMLRLFVPTYRLFYPEGTPEGTGDPDNITRRQLFHMLKFDKELQ